MLPLFPPAEHSPEPQSAASAASVAMRRRRARCVCLLEDISIQFVSYSQQGSRKFTIAFQPAAPSASHKRAIQSKTEQTTSFTSISSIFRNGCDSHSEEAKINTHIHTYHVCAWTVLVAPKPLGAPARVPLCVVRYSSRLRVSPKIVQSKQI